MATTWHPTTLVQCISLKPWLTIPGETEPCGCHDLTLGKIYELVESGACQIEGQSSKKLDMAVPFLVHFAKDGTPDQLVLGKIGCAEAEGVIGGALVVLINQGNYKSTGKNRTGWYRSQVSFSYS